VSRSPQPAVVEHAERLSRPDENLITWLPSDIAEAHGVRRAYRG